MKPTEPKTLAHWRRQLDKLIRQKTPLGLKDFPQLDADIEEAFGEGVAVAEYFDDTIRAELEDLGFPYEDLDDQEVQERILPSQVGSIDDPSTGRQADTRQSTNSPISRK